MQAVYNQAIELIKCSIEGSIYKGLVNKEIFKLMLENGLSGSVFLALDKDLTDEEVYGLFKEEYYQYIKKDQRQLEVIEEIKNIFNENKIDFILLKGSFLKKIYPESYMRSMGDVDCLIKKDKMELVHKVLEENGFKNWVISSNHDCFMKYKNINVEVHPKLDSEFTDGYEDLLADPWSNAINTNGSEYQLRVEYNLLYQIYHMIKHLYRSGVGFRSIVDIYILIKKYGNSFKKEYLNDLLMNFKNKEFFKFLICYINNVFSVTLLNEIISYDKMTNESIDDFTDFVMVSGIHGIGEDYNLFIGGIAFSSKKSGSVFIGKIKYFFSKIFLPRKQMIGMYPFVKKCFLFLPIAWIFRICRLLVNNKKNTFIKIRRFSIRKEDVKRTENLFNNIGL